MRLLEYIGIPYMLLISQAAFVFRAIGYTLLQNPLFVLFLEVRRKMNNPASPNIIASIKKKYRHEIKFVRAGVEGGRGGEGAMNPNNLSFFEIFPSTNER